MGIGLTLPGIGAPEGVVLLVSTSGIMKGVSSGTYYLIQSRQEKRFAAELRLVRSGADRISDENLERNLRDYRSLKIQFIKEFASTALSFVGLHHEAPSATGGEVGQAHDVLQRLFETAKVTGKN
jgi:hypothetical protein